MGSSMDSYVERIERALDHLQSADPDLAPPGLNELAGVAAMSPYHFHRIFRLLTGETVTGAAQRIRIARTLPVLAAGGEVTGAAAVSGYGSSQSYARAFRAIASHSPRAVRADGQLLGQVAERLKAGSASAPLSLTITSLDPIRLLAVRRTGDYAELNAGFHQLFEAVLAQLAPEEIAGLYGIPHHDPRFTPAGECLFDCAVAVGTRGEATGSLAEMQVGGPGDWLRLRHLGDYDRAHETIDLAYAAALTEHDRLIGEAPLFLHFLDDPEEVEASALRADIYLPLA